MRNLWNLPINTWRQQRPNPKTALIGVLMLIGLVVQSVLYRSPGILYILTYMLRCLTVVKIDRSFRLDAMSHFIYLQIGVTMVRSLESPQEQWLHKKPILRYTIGFIGLVSVVESFMFWLAIYEQTYVNISTIAPIYNKYFGPINNIFEIIMTRLGFRYVWSLWLK